MRTRHDTGAKPRSVSVSAVQAKTSIWRDLGALLAYPHDELGGELLDMREVLATMCPEAAGAISDFLGEVGGLSLDRVEEIYTRTFDLNPQCVPYVSVHLFGEENFKRSQLMAGLAEAYSKAGHAWGLELPDHIAVILRFAPNFGEDDWQDVVQYCLLGPLGKMIRQLERSANPYRHLLRAIHLALIADARSENSND